MKSNKYRACFLAFCCFCFVFFLSSSAWGEEAFKIYFNGSRLANDFSAIDQDGLLLAPLWLIGEKLGAEYAYDKASDSVSIKKDDLLITLKIDSNSARINGEEQIIPCSPRLINGRVIVPLEFVCEAFGADLDWQSDTTSLYITYLDTNLIVDPTTTKGLSLGKFNLPVLMYHHFSNFFEEGNNATVTPQKFEEDLQALKKAGYTTMLPQELIEAYNGGYLPKKPILITIDDGYLSNYQQAFPTLVRQGMKATIFIVGSTIGRNTNQENTLYIIPHFDLKEAKEMAASGLIFIQPHSYDLHYEKDNTEDRAWGMSRLPKEKASDYEYRLQEDTADIVKIIEAEIGEKVISYSYPYGYFNTTADKVLKSFGIVMTVTVAEGINKVDGGNLYHLKRINVDTKLTSQDLIKYLDK